MARWGTLPAQSKAVELVDTHRRGNRLHKMGNMHEKIGLSVGDQKIVCFGDSNHRVSEITHAGMMVRERTFLTKRTMGADCVNYLADLLQSRR
jgi:hypothetical protein